MEMEVKGLKWHINKHYVTRLYWRFELHSLCIHTGIHIADQMLYIFI